MKHILLKIFGILAALLNICGMCNKPPEMEVKATKEKVFNHNYVVINSVDNSPVEVEVSYSIFVRGNSDNIIKTERKTTPFVLGGEEVKVIYDSLATMYAGEVKSTCNKIQRNYTPKGADYLSIKNLSLTTDIEYAVVGNQSITYYSLAELNSVDVGDINAIPNKLKVLKSYPTPIYKETPVLYLLYPEKAPQTQVYVPWSEGRDDKGLFMTWRVYAKQVMLKPPLLGELTLNTPFSAQEVLNLYKKEFQGQSLLFENYKQYNYHIGYSSPERSLWYRTRLFNMQWYGKIAAGKEFENKKEAFIFFVNSTSKYMGYDYFDERDY